MTRKNRFIVLATLLLSMAAQAQEQTVLDGAYVREHNPTRKVIGYPNLREADVLWARRMWQMIDLRQKMNQDLYYPIDEIVGRKSLFDVIRYGLTEEGSITAYSLGPTQDDDEFRYIMEKEDLDSILNPVVIRYTEDLETGERKEVRSVEPISSADVVAYELKEDWLFDKQRSERYVRIIGVAPIVLKRNEAGEVKGTKELFWLYYPECRYIFNNFDVFNSHNNAQQMTFDQLFQLRRFSSYIIKEDNVYDRGIDQYAKGIDALLESEKIKNDLFIMEHDLWHY